MFLVNISSLTAGFNIVKLSNPIFELRIINFKISDGTIYRPASVVIGITGRKTLKYINRKYHNTLLWFPQGWFSDEPSPGVGKQTLREY